MATYPRRKFLAHAAAVAPAALLPRSVFALQATTASADPWTRADAIVKRIVAPKFAARDFDVTRYGAVGDGRTDCTARDSRRDRRLHAPRAAAASSCPPAASSPARSARAAT